MDGTASLANREIGRVLPANYRKVRISGAVDHLNKAATARYFGQLSRESLETRTGWRSGGDSNPRSHKGSRDFESRRLNQTPEPLRTSLAPGVDLNEKGAEPFPHLTSWSNYFLDLCLPRPCR